MHGRPCLAGTWGRHCRLAGSTNWVVQRQHWMLLTGWLSVVLGPRGYRREVAVARVCRKATALVAQTIGLQDMGVLFCLRCTHGYWSGSQRHAAGSRSLLPARVGKELVQSWRPTSTELQAPPRKGRSSGYCGLCPKGLRKIGSCFSIPLPTAGPRPLVSKLATCVAWAKPA